jgi:hypothetical protein
MRKPSLLDCAYILGLILFLALTTGKSAWAGTVSGCTDETCTWDMLIDGQSVMKGSYQTDADGKIFLPNPVSMTDAEGNTVSINSMNGDIDPIIVFGVGASTATGSTFGFTFNLPIALQGTIFADSSVSYSLTSATAAGAQIAPVVGSNIVSAFEVDTGVGGLPSLNKGIDVGSTLFFTGGPLTQNSPVYTASNTFTGNLAYDLMTVKVDFSLSADSSVGLSGFVQQVAVPVPAAVWLFGSGLIGLVGIARRKAA